MSRGRPRFRDLISPANPLLKIFRVALARGETREGWLAAEGPHALEEALKASTSARVRSVLVGRSVEEKFRQLLDRLPQEVEVARVPDRLFQRIAQTETPQGIATLVELRPADFDDILGRRDPLLLVACALQDPGNLGTMIRSAHALGATALITLRGTVSPFNPKSVRSSAGALFRLPVLRDLESGALFARLRAANVRILAADGRSPAGIAQADLRGPVAILIGKEATGLPSEISREASQLLSIPVRPDTDSVNAATAASIFLYEAARQRGFKY